MRFLFVHFEIPNNKIHEFDLAFHRLVKWPLYTLYESEANADRKTFELTRQWENEEEMQRELDSREFTNMIGMIKVLGKVSQSDIYDVTSQEDLLHYMN
ncbi:MAG: hypothetical protein ACR2MM_03055 [Flavobacteriaceae bacterium]